MDKLQEDSFLTKIIKTTESNLEKDKELCPVAFVFTAMQNFIVDLYDLWDENGFDFDKFTEAFPETLENIQAHKVILLTECTLKKQSINFSYLNLENEKEVDAYAIQEITKDNVRVTFRRFQNQNEEIKYIEDVQVSEAAEVESLKPIQESLTYQF